MSSDAATTVSIQVLFFASAREAVGNNVSRIDLQVDGSKANTLDLRKRLAELYPKLATMVLDEDSLTLALNEEYVLPGQILPLKAGDTVALIPPISGG
jgi:molybdopterin converting factor subunit 1